MNKQNWTATAAFVATLSVGLTALVVTSVRAPAEAKQLVDRVQARIELGRRLFFDPSISQSGVKSCVECHDPEHGYSDPSTLSSDETGATPRHSQTLLDAKFNPTVHWDGEFATVEAAILTRFGRTAAVAQYYGGRQPRTPPITPRPNDRAPVTGATVPNVNELHREARDLLQTVPARLTKNKRYDEAFQAAFGSNNITLAKVARALGDYTRSIESTESAFDRFRAGDFNAIGRPAFRGLALFRGRAGCVQCHTMDIDPKAEKALFTDWDYRNTGIADLRLRELRVSGRATGGPFTTNSTLSSRVRTASVGRRALTGHPEDEGCFKTPSLRDVAKTAPYMHDGSLKTLHQVVEYYARGCNKRSSNLDDKIRPFKASDQDVADLVAFLKTLTGSTPAGRATEAWAKRANKTTLTFMRGDKPAVGQIVVLEGVGEQLPGVRGPKRLHLKTDIKGRVTYKQGRFTHMHVVRPSPARDPIDWIPDTVSKLTIRMPQGHH